MALIVQKYGGSSLATPAQILKVAEKIALYIKKGKQLVVVVSAMGKMTDDLLALAKRISPNPAARELDMLLSAGERISMSLLSMALNEKGLSSISLTGSQSGIVTDDKHTKAKILEIRAGRIQEAIKNGKIVIIAGFQGVSLAKEVTTLGRGGSDITAVALAARLGAERCEFYKDVDGVYTKDPHIYSDAKKIDRCGYRHVLSLQREGTHVVHSEAIELAQKHSIPIYLSSTFSSATGTTIS